MKGPNAPLPLIDNFCADIEPDDWKNIPRPLVDFINRLKEVIIEFKKLSYESYNDAVQTKKIININQATAYHDTLHAKEEIAE